MKKQNNTKQTTSDSPDQAVVIKRYGNRRLYNTETKSYVTYQDLIQIIQTGNDIQVIDSTTKSDVTKAVLIQVILEEEKNQNNLLPLEFLLQIIRSKDMQTQEFFRNYLSSSFEAYLKTKEEFDRRFKSWLELSSEAPQMWEKLIPEVETMKGLWGFKKPDEESK